MCDKKWKEMHDSDITERSCDACGSNCKRSIPTSSTVKIGGGATTAGQRIERYIEETKEAVKEQLAEARREYKP